ncbi:MAG: hypothetical protein WC343_03840 [Bacilli bacterium]|jgi:hypothetical protein
MSVFGETDAPASTTELETTEARSMISLLKALKNQNISGDAVMQSKVDDMTALLEIIAEELDTA